MADGEQAIPGNGTKLAVHEHRLAAMERLLYQIDDKLDRALPRIDVHEQRLAGLDSWLGRTAGIGVSLLVVLLGFLLTHMFGG